MKTQFKAHPWPGKLIAVEGIDGSGKSTQLALLYEWLKEQGTKIVKTEWNSSSTVKPAIKSGKKARVLSPATFSLIHCTDFADRYERCIQPFLQAGYVVLCDRYIFTAFARDVARGCDKEWLYNLYAFAPLPDLTLYFDVPLAAACSRVLSRRRLPKFYEAAMDLRLSQDRTESFYLYQERVQIQYRSLLQDFSFTKIDSTLPPQQQQSLVRTEAKRVYAPHLSN